MRFRGYIRIFAAALCLSACGAKETPDLESLWENPPYESRPWVYWYWCRGAVSREGITADLEAMKEAGIAGAYLFTIDGVPAEPLIEPSYSQLTPEWWEIVGFAVSEADRLGIDIGLNACDGWALAGGPWITPELSMQKVVWAGTTAAGGTKLDIELPLPAHNEGYYRDIAVFAYPCEEITAEPEPVVSSDGGDGSPQFLADCTGGVFRSQAPCRIEYAFGEPFTCRSVEVMPHKGNYQAQRLILEASDDGTSFRRVVRLDPPRHGWQWDKTPVTYAVPAVTAKYFRFVYDPEGSEPGSEDLDKAKNPPSLEIEGIRLSSSGRIHQYEGKNGQTWRLAPRTTALQLPDSLCVDPSQLLDITLFASGGRLEWDAPEGNWNILRMGHTSTGIRNVPAGGASGLECDKFNPGAVKLQFDSWMGRVMDGSGEGSRAIKICHTDSWECASQNWSPVMRDEFRRRRGYDIVPWLPVFAGIPVGSAERSEEVLHDLRKTIAELVADNFIGTLRKEAAARGCLFSAECSAPTMAGDGLMTFRNADIPMGEFWFRTPMQDKPNDILDAVSGAHIYGKNIVQAEAFTQRRIMWDEHPGMLKAMQDREYALGVNKMVYHVYTHNPWPDRSPGLTLSDGIGLFFQRDQTWWNQGREWVDYAARCQALLQFGKPVVDLAVFAGEELPCRAVLPERLVPFLPGLFGADVAERERIRMENKGIPLAEEPWGKIHTANITAAHDWVNALRGYHYDSFNADVLFDGAEVRNGRLVLPGGMSYAVLVVPGANPMMPDARLSPEAAAKIKRFASRGLPVLSADEAVATCLLPYGDSTFDRLGIPRDLEVYEHSGDYAGGIAFAHRASDGTDIYFIANQEGRTRELSFSMRTAGRIPELWYPAPGRIMRCNEWNISEGRTHMPLNLEPYESVFVVFRKPAGDSAGIGNTVSAPETVMAVGGPWKVSFDPDWGGHPEPVVFEKLTDWASHADDRIRYYSGTAVYSQTFAYDAGTDGTRCYIDLGDVYNIASVRINGVDCGTVWTPPFRVDITDAVAEGENLLEIAVTNTWRNRMLGDRSGAALKGKRIWTNALDLPAGEPLLGSGLTGSVVISMEMPFDTSQ